MSMPSSSSFSTTMTSSLPSLSLLLAVGNSDTLSSSRTISSCNTSQCPSTFKGPSSEEIRSLSHYKNSLNNFILNAPKTWEKGSFVKNFSLFGETLNCVLWNEAFYITGTDVVKSIIWKFRLDGHVIQDRKKFEEGVFSDLRNLKPGTHAILEEPRSRFLEFLFKNNCIRTHKKQKVFFWYAVDFEKLYEEALRREQKREIEPIADTLLALSNISVMGSSSNTSISNLDHSPSTSSSSSLSSFEVRKRTSEESDMDQRKKLKPTSLSFVLNDADPSTPTSMSPRHRMDSFTSDSEASFESDDSNELQKLSKSKDAVYTCTHTSCTRQFKRYQHLRRHLKTHSGEKPYICPDSNCIKKFSKLVQLSNHINDCHTQ